MTKRHTEKDDATAGTRFHEAHDAIFNDIADMPIEEVQGALTQVGISGRAFHERFQSRVQDLATRLQKDGHEAPPFLESLLQQTSDSSKLLSAPTATQSEAKLPETERRYEGHRPRHWTNRSVLALAGDRDPVEVITERARDLVMRGLDHDWHGPPYDPLQLAAILHLEVRPLADIPDARTVPVTPDGFRIEFNPNRPIGRMRYSLAHEIAHTLFPDCGDLIRNRATHANVTRDEWQLEALCNIAAAELLMPFGSFPTVDVDLVDINRILILQKQFKVSTEALLLRVIHLATTRCAAFSASQIEGGRDAGRWRVDYVIGTRRWKHANLRGLSLPPETSLAECAKIGFTMRRDEVWAGTRLRVEAVALPPYPGAIAPRVAGFLIDPEDIAGRDSSALSEIFGDALSPRGEGPKLIVHVVTDRAQTWGGGGFAAAVRRRWPEIHEDFRTWAGTHGLTLGTVRFCAADSGTRVASMVAQHGYGPQGSARIRYTALAQCITEVFQSASLAGETIHMPRIGTGHGGGSWPIIRDILQDAVAATLVSATVYRLPSQTSQPEQTGLSFGQPVGGGTRG